MRNKYTMYEEKALSYKIVLDGFSCILEIQTFSGGKTPDPTPHPLDSDKNIHGMDPQLEYKKIHNVYM